MHGVTPSRVSTPPCLLKSALPQPLLQHHTRLLHLSSGVSLSSLAVCCRGYVGADLAALCREAALIAMADTAAAAAAAAAPGATTNAVATAAAGAAAPGATTNATAAAAIARMTQAEGQAFLDALVCAAELRGASPCSGVEEAASDSTTDERERGVEVRGVGRAEQDGSGAVTGTEVDAEAGFHGRGLGGHSAKWSGRASESEQECKSHSFEIVLQHRHFESAKLRVGPSVVRGVTAEVPAVKWEDIGGLESVKVRGIGAWLFQRGTVTH